MKARKPTDPATAADIYALAEYITEVALMIPSWDKQEFEARKKRIKREIAVLRKTIGEVANES